jgi:hypothetical protein
MNRFFKAALLTGLFAGTTDILYAFTNSYIKSGNFAEKLFHYLAGGALGLERSMSGGTGVAFLGLFFHYFIAISFTFFFFWIFPRLKFLSWNKYLVGMLYGVFVNLAMRLIVYLFTPLPPPAKFLLERQFIDWVIFGIVFGIPIAYNTYKFYGVKNPPLVQVKI